MVIDTSAVLAILLEEPECDAFITLVARQAVMWISAANFVEAGMVLRMRGVGAPILRLDQFRAEFAIEIAPVTAEHATAALHAFQKYGKGIHPAKLNYGDCFAYALAKVTGEPLLFKGNDFTHTDLEPAIKPLP